jgi:glycosyltransferase involved in cell wall biosynthesis
MSTSAAPDISVVIPVHDAADTVGPLLTAFEQVPDCTVELIAVDDASTDGSRAVLGDAHEAGRITAVHHAANAGAGVARNTGFALASGRYCLFFDADDEVVPEAVARCVNVLDETGASVAVTPYRYRRSMLDDYDAMNVHDVDVWSAYVTGGQVRVADLRDVPRLLGFSNYPWNKVVRTEHYRSTGLRFGSTPVNNDILGHWMTLLHADRIALVDEVMCNHVVLEGGGNLTLRHTRDRLALFDALDETYDHLEAHPHLRNRYSHHYWATALRVADWARARVADDVQEEFLLRLQRHLLRMNLADFTRIRTKRDSALADLIVRRALA